MKKQYTEDREEMFANCDNRGSRPKDNKVEVLINGKWIQTSAHKNRYTAKINADTKGLKQPARVKCKGEVVYETKNQK